MRLIAKRTYENIDDQFVADWIAKNLSERPRSADVLQNTGIASYSEMVRGKMVHTMIFLEPDPLPRRKR